MEWMSSRRWVQFDEIGHAHQCQSLWHHQQSSSTTFEKWTRVLQKVWMNSCLMSTFNSRLQNMRYLTWHEQREFRASKLTIRCPHWGCVTLSNDLGYYNYQISTVNSCSCIVHYIWTSSRQSRWCRKRPTLNNLSFKTLLCFLSVFTYVMSFYFHCISISELISCYFHCYIIFYIIPFYIIILYYFSVSSIYFVSYAPLSQR